MKTLEASFGLPQIIILPEASGECLGHITKRKSSSLRSLYVMKPQEFLPPVPSGIPSRGDGFEALKINHEISNNGISI